MVTVNSVIVSGCITAATLFFCTLAGYAFAKMGFRSRGGPMTAVIATLTIPPQLSVVPLFMMMSDIGWGGKLESVIFPTLVSAFGVFFMRQYLTEALPYELIEAAKVDGANNFRIVRSVVLPVARPAMMVLGMLTFVQAWNDFFWPYLALNQQNPTLQVALGRLSASYTPDQSIVMAGALISTLPLLVVFVIFGKQIVGVIMSGAVKRWQRHVVAVAVVVVVPATAQTSVTLNLQRPRARRLAQYPTAHGVDGVLLGLRPRRRPAPGPAGAARHAGRDERPQIRLGTARRGRLRQPAQPSAI